MCRYCEFLHAVHCYSVTASAGNIVGYIGIEHGTLLDMMKCEHNSMLHGCSSSSSSSSRDGLIGPLPAKCRPEAFDAHSFTTFRERGKTG